jgi:predicted RNA-binding Zn ribbon-like protein
MTDFRKGNGAAWLDFLATRIGRYRAESIEMLPDPEALQTWLSEQDLAPSTAPNEQDLLLAWKLREALHAIASSALEKTAPSRAALNAIERALTADKPLQIRPSKSRVRTVQPLTAAEALARLARSAVTDLSGPQREHLRACADETCSGIFIDHTGRRQWCSDQLCGNRARVRAHRQRERAKKGK